MGTRNKLGSILWIRDVPPELPHIIQYEDQHQGGRNSLLCYRTHAHEQPAFLVEEAADQRHGNLCWLKSCLKPGNK